MFLATEHNHTTTPIIISQALHPPKKFLPRTPGFGCQVEPLVAACATDPYQCKRPKLWNNLKPLLVSELKENVSSV